MKGVMDMNYNFLDFTKERYPEIWEEFFRYKRKDIMPAIGTEVVTLRSGFGDFAGVTRYVVSHDEKYIGLACNPHREAEYLSTKEDWWKDLKIINEPVTE